MRMIANTNNRIKANVLDEIGVEQKPWEEKVKEMKKRKAELRQQLDEIKAITFLHFNTKPVSPSPDSRRSKQTKPQSQQPSNSKVNKKDLAEELSNAIKQKLSRSVLSNSSKNTSRLAKKNV